MFQRFRFAVLLSLLLPACAPAGPRAAPEPEIVPDTFLRPLLRPVPVPAPYREALERETRSPSGAPGPRYWQQRVRYRIDAELDPRNELLRGSETVVYRNQSPDTLRDVVLNLYQNIFSQGVPRNRYVQITGGMTLERVEAGGQALPERTSAEIPTLRSPPADAPVGYAVQGTLGRLVLPRPLLPGDSTVLRIAWHYTVPPAGTFRTAWEDALGGRVFQVAQWYPQVATYDDLRGWDATPYLGDGEFYLEYGDWEVNLTLPAGWLVGATGELQNPDAVLSAEARSRLAAALRSDSSTHVVTAGDVAAGRITRGGAGKLTWRFRARNVRDFAWVASDRYAWDVVPVTIPADTATGAGARVVPVNALYRPGAPGWEQAALYGRHATHFFSELLIPYVYPQITVSEGPVFGMEYPQLVFIARPSDPADLYAVIAHEIGHQWFPMAVGSPEARYAWMDEGFTTYDENRAREDFFAGSDPWATELARYLSVAGTEAEVPLMRHTDLVSPYGARTVAAYSKPAVLLRALGAVMGDSAFRAGMREYAHTWLGKHPQPWDFFHTMERAAGRALDWFWYPWWWETGTLDLAVGAVEQPDTASVVVTVEDRGQIPVPAAVVVTGENGIRVAAEIPIEVWTVDRRRVATLTLPFPGRATRVEIDPDGFFPDMDRSNNVWTAPGAEPSR